MLLGQGRGWGSPLVLMGPTSPHPCCVCTAARLLSLTQTEFLSHYSSSSGALLAPGHVLRYDCLVQHFTQSSGPLPDEGSTAISTGYREAWGLRGELESGPCVSSTCRAAEVWSHPPRAPAPSHTCWAEGTLRHSSPPACFLLTPPHPPHPSACVCV